ncbi:GtrA family protein [Erwinia endophytica]|uniref:GtrA family protein n=1 Tax=Erwinia endophytica TaxID=1563158 RepID=UPI001265D881|nr:GtrA family protein [Erwinia endophytica]KAB8307382.1 GtrA family protein [Erwinia endophytica]
MLKLFTMYTSVGMFNTAIHWLIFAAMLYAGSSQSTANLAAFCVAVTFSFFANAKWTFSAKATTIRYAMYVFFMGAMAAGVGNIADYAHINPVITLISFSAISLVAGFIYSNFIVFREKK